MHMGGLGGFFVVLSRRDELGLFNSRVSQRALKFITKAF